MCSPHWFSFVHQPNNYIGRVIYDRLSKCITIDDLEERQLFLRPSLNLCVSDGGGEVEEKKQLHKAARQGCGLI
jgi:hypothetical protein